MARRKNQYSKERKITKAKAKILADDFAAQQMLPQLGMRVLLSSLRDASKLSWDKIPKEMHKSGVMFYPNNSNTSRGSESYKRLTKRELKSARDFVTKPNEGLSIWAEAIGVDPNVFIRGAKIYVKSAIKCEDNPSFTNVKEHHKLYLQLDAYNDLYLNKLK